MRGLLRQLPILALALGCGAPEPSVTEPTEVTVYDPNAAWNGYTLAFHARQYPILIDMRGQVVREWPEVRVKSRVRLLEDCSLLAIGMGRAVVEHDWRGHQTWSARFEGRFPHHDVIRLANGNTMVLTRERSAIADDVVEVDRAGRVVWEWRSAEPLESFIERGKPRGADSTHMNSVQVLPENPWYRAGDERFRPGNVLLSARNLNLVLIVDKETGEVVWTYEGDLDLQHEALMIGPESERNGHIAIFNNRFASFHDDRRSEVIEIDPRDASTVWSYSAPGLYSPTSGAQQPLPNGNVMITSSTGGRALEVDRAGRTVWEWVPPFRLNRPNRYARDHCPELAALTPPDGPPIRPTGYRHVDSDAYRFSRAAQHMTVEIGGEKRLVLQPDHRCARIVIPESGSAKLRYGVDRARILELGLDSYVADFSVSLGKPGSEQRAVVFEDSIDAAGDDWNERLLDLGAVALETLEMCVDIEERGLTERAEPGQLAFWSPPSIRDRSGEEPEEETLGDLTAEELAVRQEHLRAMGYVN